MRSRIAYIILILILISGISACEDTDNTTGKYTDDPSGMSEPGETTNDWENASLTVSVTNGGKPLPGAAVRAIDAETLESTIVLTDPSGTAGLVIPETKLYLLEVTLNGCQPYADWVVPGDNHHADVSLNALPPYKRWVMAFATHDSYPLEYQKTATVSIWLAHSDNGLQWELLQPEPIYETPLPSLANSARRSRYLESAYFSQVVPGSPEAVIKDGELVIYVDDKMIRHNPQTGKWVAHGVNQEAAGWKAAGPTDSIDRLFGFFDHQVCAAYNGTDFLLFGKNRLGYGYSALNKELDIGNSESLESLVFGFCKEVRNGGGYAFVCPEDRFSMVQDEDLYEKEPCIIRHGEKWLLMMSGSKGLHLYEADNLKGPYESLISKSFPGGMLYSEPWVPESGWDEGKDPKHAKGLAGACMTDIGNGLYRIYLSYVHSNKVLMTETDLTKPLENQEDAFTLVLDASILPDDQKAVAFLGNPSVIEIPSLQHAPVTNPAGSVDPVAYTFGTVWNTGVMTGMGSSSRSYSNGADSATLTMSYSGEGSSWQFMVPDEPGQPMHTNTAASTTLTLPDIEGAMGGIVIDWQYQGRYNGGTAFLTGRDSWQLVSFSIGQISGRISPIIAPEQIQVIAEGTLETPFEKGRLAMIHTSGSWWLLIDGKQIGRVQETEAGGEVTVHTAGYTGICVIGNRDMASYTFDNVIVTGAPE